MRDLLLTACIAALSLSPCYAQPGGAKPDDKKTDDKKSGKADDSSKQEESIGVATMTKDGTIILNLRSKSADGTIAEGRFVYPKEHKQYAEILKHLGGLKPGESKPVRPWPDK